MLVKSVSCVLSPSSDAALEDGIAADVAVAADDRAVDDGVLADARVRPHDGVLQIRGFFDDHAAADHRVGADRGAGS